MKRPYNEIFLFFFIFVLFFTQGISFGYDYFDTQSSACLNCTVFEEVLRYSFGSTLLFSLVFIVIEKLRKKSRWSHILYALLFVLNMFFMDYMLFESRISSWSTYTFLESILSVLYKSTPLLIFFSLLFFVYYKMAHANRSNEN